MEYTVGTAGRVIAARLFEGEELYESIESIAEKEKIKSAAVLITGGIRKADVVVGPKTETPKIEPNFKKFQGPGEVLGVGTIYCDDTGKPKLHLHAGMGRGDKYIVGCPRGGASIFLILEVTIIEITGIDAKRETDPLTGFKLLRIKKSITNESR
jgi:predicted DNA-binding protein with PD1-like motif